MRDVLVTLIFGFMMMVVMRRKAKIISREICVKGTYCLISLNVTSNNDK